MRHPSELFGPGASDSTAWRALSECNGRGLARDLLVRFVLCLRILYSQEIH